MTYLDELKIAIEAGSKSSQQKEIKEAEKWRHALTPLEDRVKKILADIPDEIKRSGLSLNALQKMLSGRWRGHCHPGELGQALRKLGYVRVRHWSGDKSGFVALWKIIQSS
jgi:hypothetical protein